MLAADLWTHLLDLCTQHDVVFEWIKGHAGSHENERCDQLALHAAQQPGLPADECYEQEVTTIVMDDDLLTP